MPKNKTHRGTAKRVKVSATGKLLRQRAGKRHLLEKKSSRVTRRLDGVVQVAKQDANRHGQADAAAYVEEMRRTADVRKNPKAFE